MDGERKVSLGQALGGEDHARKVLREKIGDIATISGEGVGAVIEMAAGDQSGLVEKIVEQLRTVFDPEIPLNVYDLGLIYKIAVDLVNAVTVDMTLTAPGCPVAGAIVAEVKRKVEGVGEVAKTTVNLVWTPQWTRERLSEEARLELGFM